MNDTSYTLLRKKIAVHVQVLSAIMILGILLYAYNAAMFRPNIAMYLSRFVFHFSIWGWMWLSSHGLMGVVSGILVLGCFGLFFYWGRAYRNRGSMGKRILYWLVGFIIILTITWTDACTGYLQMIFPPRQLQIIVIKPPVDVVKHEHDFDAAKVIIERTKEMYPLGKVADRFLLLLVLGLYTAETVWLFSMVLKAERYRKAQDANAGG